MPSKTPSRKRKRERFLFDEIEEDILREENDSNSVAMLSEKLPICLDGTCKDDETTVNIMRSEVLQESHTESGDFQSRDSGKAEDEECLSDVSSSDDMPSEMPSFLQQLQTLQAMMHKVESSFPDLIFAMATTGKQPVLQVSQRQLHNHPPFGMVSRVHGNVLYDSYTAYVLMRKWETGTLGNNEDASELCLKFCEKSDYEKEYYTSIRFHIKSVQRMEFPFARVDSVNCLLWFKLAPNATADEKSCNEVRCRHCKRLVLDLECQKRRTIAEAP